MISEDAIDQLREALRILIRKLGFIQKSEAACCGITFSQCHAISEIGRVGTITLNQLAARLNLDRSTMSRTVDNLVNNKLAVRETDPNDRRYIIITLTDRGWKTLTAINHGIDHNIHRIMKSVPKDKQKLVTEALFHLATAIKNTDSLGPLTDNCCQNSSKTRHERIDSKNEKD